MLKYLEKKLCLGSEGILSVLQAQLLLPHQAPSYLVLSREQPVLSTEVLRPGQDPVRKILLLAGSQETGKVILPAPAISQHGIFLTDCPDLRPARQRVFSLWTDNIRNKPHIFPVIEKYTLYCEYRCASSRYGVLVRPRYGSDLISSPLSR